MVLEDLGVQEVLEDLAAQEVLVVQEVQQVQEDQAQVMAHQVCSKITYSNCPSC